MSISPRFLEDIRGRLTLSEVIGRRTKVTRAGREFKACCPFHKEKTPSFTINDQKQFYHCFGCGAHGDVIGFTMQHDNLSFVEAVETLAAQAGLQMPKPDPAFIEKEKRAKDLYAVVDAACTWFEQQLSESSHRDVFDYLLKRGVSENSISSFRIGYAPSDGQGLRTYMIDKGFEDKDMIEAGVLRVSTKGGNPYSFFRDRVMFPVSDRRGRVVAFGGRVLPDHMRSPQQGDFTPPKYINSADTPLFHKGRMLFGESHARQAARDGHTPIVVEGYLDVIACHQAGLQGAVAPLGTAMTEDQIMSLWSMITKEEKVPVLCFDGDNAGRRAAERACERMIPLLKPNHSALLAFLPDGEDPDSFLQNKGKRAFVAQLQTALTLSEFLWNMNVGEKTYQTPESRAGLEMQLNQLVSQIQDSSVQHHYKSAFKNKLWEFFKPKFNASKGAKSGRWKGTNKTNGASDRHVPLHRPARSQKHARNVSIMLATLINHPYILLDVAENLEGLSGLSDEAHQISDSIYGWYSEKQENGENLLDSEELKHHLSEVGLEEAVNDLLNPRVYAHASFARSDASEEKARQGLSEMIGRIGNAQLEDDLKMAQRELLLNFSPEAEARVLEMRRLLEESRSIMSSAQVL
ncbi:MAG: DNA primase [Alphaproteobacteria bacterium]|nr:DNA primase [Alphaproteobacteria bacterium]